MIKQARIIRIEKEVCRQRKAWVNDRSSEGSHSKMEDVYQYRIVCQTKRPIKGETIFATEWSEHNPEPDIKFLNAENLSVKYSLFRKGVEIVQIEDIKALAWARRIN